MNTFELDSKYVAQTYRRFPVEIVSGKGAVAYDANCKKYIDMGSGSSNALAPTIINIAARTIIARSIKRKFFIIVPPKLL